MVSLPLFQGARKREARRGRKWEKGGCAHAGLEEESVKEIPWSMLMNEDRSRFSLSLSFSLVVIRDKIENLQPPSIIRALAAAFPFPLQLF